MVLVVGPVADVDRDCEEAYPSCSNTPEPYANAYRIGASKFATIDSSRARVELDTGKNWFFPNEGGSFVSVGCRCETVGRGRGYRRGLVLLELGSRLCGGRSDGEGDEEEEGTDSVA